MTETKNSNNIVARNVQTGGVPNHNSTSPFSSLRRLDIFLTFMVLLLVGIATVQFFQIRDLQNTPRIVVDNQTDISGLDVPEVPVLPKESIK